MPFQEDCSRLGAPNELTGAAQLVSGHCRDHAIPMLAYVCVTDSPRPDRQTLRQFLMALEVAPTLVMVMLYNINGCVNFLCAVFLRSPSYVAKKTSSL
jgi:hypothetical protein